MVRGILLHIVYDIRNEMKRFSTKKEKKKQIKMKPKNPVLTLAQTPSRQKKRREKKQPQNLVFQ